MTDEEVLQAAVRAYKDNPRLELSLALNWLTVPLKRVIATIEPMIRADERSRCGGDQAG